MTLVRPQIRESVTVFVRRIREYKKTHKNCDKAGTEFMRGFLFSRVRRDYLVCVETCGRWVLSSIAFNEPCEVCGHVSKVYRR